MLQLEGKRALVTGASGGIGQAIVSRFRDEGATVAGNDIRSYDADKSISGDLADPEFCDALPQLAADELGGLDILVNNAGIITRGSNHSSQRCGFQTDDGHQCGGSLQALPGGHSDNG